MEQVGRPFEIYNFPATPFVASFVGTLNLLPAQVVNAATGELSIAGQPVKVDRRFEAPAGRTMNVALRPEMASLGTEGGVNKVRGEVVDVSFLGSFVRIRVRLGGEGSPVVALDEFNEPTLRLPEIGATADVSFPSDGPLVLDSAAQLESVEELIAEA